MKINIIKALSIMAAVIFLSITVLELESDARAGGGRSGGMRGSRSYSAPSKNYFQSAPTQQQAAPSPRVQPAPFQQPAGGGFLRSMGGGILGGLLGGMLFSSLGFAGTGGLGGSGIGLFEIILVAGIGYMIFRMVRSRREQSLAYQGAYSQGGSAATYQPPVQPPVQPVNQPYAPQVTDRDAGLQHIRQFDPSFDEGRFKDAVMDIFFRIQGAWMNRDLAPMQGLLTDDMRGLFQDDIDRMLREKTVNRLENIAVRNVEVAEAWQETGQDFVTVLVYANLLDYTARENGEIIAGSKTEPVKFEEYWTFTRAVGSNPWRLSAINQAE